MSIDTHSQIGRIQAVFLRRHLDENTINKALQEIYGSPSPGRLPRRNEVEPFPGTPPLRPGVVKVKEKKPPRKYEKWTAIEIQQLRKGIKPERRSQISCLRMAYRLSVDPTNFRKVAE